MLDDSKIILSQQTTNRINNLHDDKIEINRQKIAGLGYIDVDDHGFIYYKDFKFAPQNNHPSGMVCGMKAIAENFSRFLKEMPKYVNKNSALAGCWVGRLDTFIKLGFCPEDEPVHLKEVFDKYKVLHPGVGFMNHCAPDMNIGIRLGWQGLKEKVEFYKTLHAPEDTTFFDGEIEFLQGIQKWILLTAQHTKQQADNETDPVAKANLLEIAEMNERLAYNAPKTFREVCQFMAHFQCIDRTYFAGGSLCQLDEVLLPYFNQDKSSGILDDDQAVWIIASLLFNDTHYSQICGLIPDGSRDRTNRLSFIILDAMHHLKIPANIALRVSDKVNETILNRSIEYTIEDGSGVDYSCNVGCEEGFAKNGYPIQVARQRAKTGCNWTALPGVEYPLQDVTRCNMAIALTYALEDVKKSGNPSLESLWEAFTHHTKVLLDALKDGYDWHYEKISRNTPEIILNLFMHGPIEKGLNAAEGGVDIISFCIDGVALATVADSFAAIEQRIVNEGKLTWGELFEALDSNYDSNESVRLMLKNIPRFGNPNSVAEKWAIDIKTFFTDYAMISTPKHGLKIIPGMFSHGDVYMYGNVTPATPNGRKMGEAISHSNEPDPGFAMGLNSFSPTLKATAVAKVQPGFGNSSPLHLDIDKNMLSASGGVEALAAVIHSHNRMGGTLINLNCLSKEKLLAAHENPEKYPDLLVRVTGYSAFFSSLSKEYRTQIIERVLD